MPLLARPSGHGSLSSAHASANGATVPRHVTPGRNASKPEPATRSRPRTSRGQTREVSIGRDAIDRAPAASFATSDTDSGVRTSSRSPASATSSIARRCAYMGRSSIATIGASSALCPRSRARVVITTRRSSPRRISAAHARSRRFVEHPALTRVPSPFSTTRTPRAASSRTTSTCNRCCSGANATEAAAFGPTAAAMAEAKSGARSRNGAAGCAAPSMNSGSP